MARQRPEISYMYIRESYMLFRAYLVADNISFGVGYLNREESYWWW